MPAPSQAGPEGSHRYAGLHFSSEPRMARAADAVRPWWPGGRPKASAIPACETYLSCVIPVLLAQVAVIQDCFFQGYTAKPYRFYVVRQITKEDLVYFKEDENDGNLKRILDEEVAERQCDVVVEEIGNRSCPTGPVIIPVTMAQLKGIEECTKKQQGRLDVWLASDEGKATVETHSRTEEVPPSEARAVTVADASKMFAEVADLINEKLEGFVGQEEVKQHIHAIGKKLVLAKIEGGMKPKGKLHIILTGSPGTGKVPAFLTAGLEHAHHRERHRSDMPLTTAQTKFADVFHDMLKHLQLIPPNGTYQAT